MANKRIKDLSTTAAVTASDDFIAVDGATNGTRKLDAYSPTFGGNLTVSGGTITGGTSGLSLASGGTNQNITLTPSGTGKMLLKLGDVDSQVNVEKRGTADIAFLGGNAAGSAARTLYFQGASVQFGIGGVGEVGRFAPSTGNFLIGTTVDSSALLQVGTNTTTAAGGMKFGTDVSLYRAGVGVIALQDGVNGTPSFALYNLGTKLFDIQHNGTNAVFRTFSAANGMTFSTGNATTALTLDSSQNATFAGTVSVSNTITTTGSNAAIFFNSRTGANSNYAWYSPDGTVARLYDNTNAKTLVDFAANTGNATFSGTIKPQQAATASAPTYVKGAIYFDTTLNKLRVGGATGWETITSV